MRKWLLVSVGIVGMVIMVVMSGCFEPPTTTNTVYIYPQSSYKAVEEQFTISIKCDSIQEINGFETSLKFNKTHIRVISWEWEDFFSTDSFKSVPIIDNVNGIVFDIYAVSIGLDGAKSNKPIITFTCIPISTGTSKIELYNTNIVNASGIIPCELINGTLISAYS